MVSLLLCAPESDSTRANIVLFCCRLCQYCQRFLQEGQTNGVIGAVNLILQSWFSNQYPWIAPEYTFSIPPVDEPVVFTLTNEAWVTLETTSTSSEQLCLLTLEGEQEGASIPVARSYSGHNWERAGGGFAATNVRQEWQCSDHDGSTVCTNLLPTGTRYVLRTMNVPPISSEAEVARFLEAASFGATPLDLQEWRGIDREEYIMEQMYAVPATLHREHFRKRANGVATADQREISSRLDPCSGDSSSWRRQVVTVWDQGQTLLFNKTDEGNWQVSINGHIRTVVPEISFVGRNRQVGDGNSYKICSSDDEIRRGIHKIRVQRSCLQLQELLVSFPDSSLDRILELDGLLPSLDDTREWQQTSSFVPEYFLKSGLPSEYCSGLPNPHMGTVVSPIFARTESGEWMQHDPRLELATNTIESPLVDGGRSFLDTNRTQFCSNVRRSFLNEQTCLLSNVPSCLPGSDGSSHLTTGTIVCGSPGEVANDPSLGDQWLEFGGLEDDPGFAFDVDPRHIAQQRETVWADIALRSEDQLRQRAAWYVFYG